jgi:DNA-binding GntR family transcriptional regulator
MFMYQDTDGNDESGASDRFKTGQVHGRLKHLLVSQSVPPRTKLDTGLLARHLGVSKTPVREALILLANEGIILNVPGNGYFSKPLNVDEIAEDYDLALTILKHVIEIDTISFSKARHALAKTLPSASLAPGDEDSVRSFSDFIEALYERVARMADNRRYLQIVHTFNGRTTFVRQLDLQRPDRFRETISGMAELIDCLDRMDGKGAIANLDRQFKSKIDILYDLVKEGNLRAMNASDNWASLLK